MEDNCFQAWDEEVLFQDEDSEKEMKNLEMNVPPTRSSFYNNTTCDQFEQLRGQDNWNKGGIVE